MRQPVLAKLAVLVSRRLAIVHIIPIIVGPQSPAHGLEVQCLVTSRLYRATRPHSELLCLLGPGYFQRRGGLTSRPGWLPKLVSKLSTARSLPQMLILSTRNRVEPNLLHDDNRVNSWRKQFQNSNHFSNIDTQSFRLGCRTAGSSP